MWQWTLSFELIKHFKQPAEAAAHLQTPGIQCFVCLPESMAVSATTLPPPPPPSSWPPGRLNCDELLYRCHKTRTCRMWARRQKLCLEFCVLGERRDLRNVCIWAWTLHLRFLCQNKMVHIIWFAMIAVVIYQMRVVRLLCMFCLICNYILARGHSTWYAHYSPRCTCMHESHRVEFSMPT